MDGGEDMKQGGEAANVNTGFDRERESSTICNLQDLKNERMGLLLQEKLVFLKGEN